MDKLLQESLIQWIDSLSLLPEAEMLAMILSAVNSEDARAETLPLLYGKEAD